MTNAASGKGWRAHAKASNLVAARAYVKQYAPYMCATLYALVPSPVDKLMALVGGPMGVNESLVLIYDPEWVESSSVKMVATALMHECMHAQLAHVRRGRCYSDAGRFNRAGDLFINGTMRSQTRQVRDITQRSSNGSNITTEPMWEFPDWVLMPEKYSLPVGLTADEYYKLLEEQESKSKSGNKKAKCQHGKGDEGQEGDGGEGGSPCPECANGETPKILSGCCGGIAGNSISKELEKELGAKQGRSDANVKNIARETARSIKQHMESQRGRGTLPGDWSELIEISETVFDVPWRSKLANMARLSIGNIRSGGLDYSMRRPSKRSYLRGITLPGLVGYDPILFFIVDSSGSMGVGQIADALKIMSDIMIQTGILHAWFMEADTTGRRKPIQVSPTDLRSIEILGRGGTDFSPAINYVDQEFSPRPHLVVYLTDGAGSSPAVAPRGIQFIWCIVPTPYKAKPADWGEIIELDDLVESEVA